MIYDDLKYIARYKGIHPNIDQAIDMILNYSFDMAEGRIPLDGEDLFANVNQYTPKQLSEAAYEVHKQYADIQIMLEGEELIYGAPVKDLQCIQPYNRKKDIGFYEGEATEVYVLKRGNFVLCMPGDAHMAGVEHGVYDLKKIVFKVKVGEGGGR